MADRETPTVTETGVRPAVGPARPVTARDLEWVDEFVASIRPHVRVRADDSLLILVPNQVHKLNPTGVGILSHLLDGGRIADVVRRVNGDADRLEQLLYFFFDLCALVQGNLHEQQARRAVERIPFQQPFTVLPVLSEVALTYRCNLRCRFCYAACGCHADDGGAAAPRREMTTAEVGRVLTVLAREAKVPSVSFTGGEPTLRPDLAELVAQACTLGLRVNLITNGTRVDEPLARRLREAGLSSAQVSLEAASAATHDALTGVPGSHAATLCGIRNLVAADIRTHTNTTVNRQNLAELADLLGRVRDLGLTRLSMNLVIPAGAAREGHADLMVPYGEIGPVVRRLADQARELGLTFLWYSPTPLCLFNPIAEGLGNKSCAACDGLLSVAPDGGVLPCSSYPEAVGNLLHEDFAAIWGSARARYFRSKGFVPDLCRECEDVTVCACACPLYWDRCGYGELLPVAPRRRPAAAVAAPPSTGGGT